MPIDPPQRQIRLGLIGTGLAIEKLHWPALRQMPGHFRVVAFSDYSSAAAQSFAQRSGTSLDDYHPSYHDLLARDDVDAVLIALPIPALYPAARAAVEAGKHVLCEKPTGSNMEQADAFLSLTTQFPECKLLVGENFFYQDALRLARALLDEAAIGPLHLATSRFVSQLIPRAGEFSSTLWRQMPHYRGGPQLDAGVHHVAEIRLAVW